MNYAIDRRALARAGNLITGPFPAIPTDRYLATGTARDFFSGRMGCQLFQPVYGLDLGALCMRS